MNASFSRLAWMMWVLSPCPLLAQSPSIEPPLTGRLPDFSNIVGKYKISATAAPASVAVEQPILLQIVITGEGPAKYEPRREFLRLFPETWEKDFYIEEMRDDHTVDRAKKTWTFVYRLKPKHTKIAHIDGIKLVYYDPLAMGNSKFITKYVDDPIPIDVKPAPDPIEPAMPADIAPESFYQNIPLEADQAFLPAFLPLPLPVVVGFLAGVPLLCLVGVFLWKKCNPNESERRRRQRSRAADHAVEQLQTAKHPVWQIVPVYLRERFDLAQEDPTPAEAAATLLRRGFAKALCARCKTVLERCDALRYGATPGSDVSSLSEEAIRLIAALEADACAH